MDIIITSDCQCHVISTARQRTAYSNWYIVYNEYFYDLELV